MGVVSVYSYHNYQSTTQINMPGKGKKSAQQESSSEIHSGVFMFANGERYDGEYIYNSRNAIERHGKGTHTLSNGVIYSGQWQVDKMTGQGCMEHPSGSSYRGEFVNNEYHGVGVYKWSDGSKFCGNFDHNKMTGKGDYIDAEGKTWSGEFLGKSAIGLRLKIK